MLRQPVSPAMLELPLLRDLNLDHILELHYSSSTLVVLNAMQDNFLLNQDITPDPVLKQHPEFLFLSMALPNPNPHNPLG